jgi:adenylate cyclase
MTKNSKNRLLQICVSTVFLFCLLWLRLLDPALMSTMRGTGFDTLQRWWPRQNTEAMPVRIVDIDEASLKQLGQWPWSRITLAKIVDRLHGLGAAAIAFDIVFPEADRLSPKQLLADPDISKALSATTDINALPDSDVIFAAALAQRPTIVAFATSTTGTPSDKLPTKTGFVQTGASAMGAPPQFKYATTNLPSINGAAAGHGGINIDLAGQQGVARNIPFLWSDGKRFVPSLVVEALRVAQGVDTIIVNAAPDTENAIETLRIGDLEIPLSEQGFFPIYFRPDAADLYISAADLLDPVKAEALRPKLEGNIVFIGTSAVGLLDVRTTTLGESVPGVSVHAQAAEQILQGNFLVRPEWLVALELAGTTILGLLIATAAAFVRPISTMAIAVSCLGASLLTSVLAFRGAGLLLDGTFPAFALVLTSLAGIAWRLIVTDSDRRQMRKLFGHYVAPAVLADIENNPQNFKLGGEVREVTVMFLDIENFTPLSEKLSPEELVQTVNGLWNVCSNAILAQQGTIDKFIGDAIMAFWNAPVAVADHQCRAARAALNIRKAVELYNEKPSVRSLLATKGVVPIAVRVGLASGPACVGNMGSEERFDYSVLGETVNTAARTEATCKRIGHDILIAGTLHAATQKLAILPAGHAAMKGISKHEPIFVVFGDELEKASSRFVEFEKQHSHHALNLAQNPKPARRESIRLALHDMALNHPSGEKYLKAMAERPEDFKDFKLAPAHE